MNAREVTGVGQGRALTSNVRLDMLGDLYPVRGVLVVGAGSAISPWVQWLATRSAERVWLVEGEENQYRHLQRHMPSEGAWVLRSDVVAGSAGATTFYCASNPAESGLIAPERLGALWPNLKTVGTQADSVAVTLDNLWDEAGHVFNWLVVDCLPAGSLLEGGTRLLEQADVVIVRVYSGQELESEPAAELNAVNRVLSAAGLRFAQSWPLRHPALAHALYVRDVARQGQDLAAARVEVARVHEQLKAARLQLDQQVVAHKTELDMRARLTERAEAEARERGRVLEAGVSELNHAVEQAHAQVAQYQHELEQARVAMTQQEAARLRVEQQLADHKSKLDERARLTEYAEAHAREQAQALDARIGELSQALAQAHAQVAQYQHEVEQARVAMTQQEAEFQNRLAGALTLSEKLDQHQAQQVDAYRQGLKDVETHLRTDMAKGLTNAVKQIEAFVSIQNYLTTGDGLTEFHGWPISPDIGLYLIERIRERNYDVVIEFGSGTSTTLFAKALRVVRGTSSFADVANSDTCSLYSFEHDYAYHGKTARMLESHGLRPQVELIHAPLTDWEDETGRYLFYDCEALLAALAQRMAGSRKRVLVLVDGPPGATCANARYPAVPIVFKHLAIHEIDVVLDDANRPEEKAVIDLWRAFWKQRSIRVSEANLASEKGIYTAVNLV